MNIAKKYPTMIDELSEYTLSIPSDIDKKEKDRRIHLKALSIHNRNVNNNKK